MMPPPPKVHPEALWKVDVLSHGRVGEGYAASPPIDRAPLEDGQHRLHVRIDVCLQAAVRAT
eukprot:2434307-Prymnesium_polylepis.1